MSTSKWITALALGSALVVSGCATGSVGTKAIQVSSGGTLNFEAFQPFSGPDADFGPEMLTTCKSTILAINRAGGILGHKTACGGVDTHGDPADAVTAAQQMIATTPNLVGILGPSSDEALATAPILNQAHIPMFADTGQAAFDHTQLHYFWRVTPADDVKGDAMAIWAHEHGFTKGAVLFGNDLASQSNVPTLVKGFEAEGGHIVSTLNIALDQVSYRTEIENMLASNPQFIFTETDPPTAATFFTEMLQLNHQKLLPIIGTEQSLQANFLQAVSQAIGVPTLKKYLVGVQPYAPTSGASWKVFKQVIFAGKGATHANLEVYSTDPFAMSYYDSVVTMALAMEAAKSVSPAKYNSFIKTVTEPGKGKLEVHSFAQGEKALEAGHKIRFVGSTGIIAFDASGNSTGGFEVAGYRSPGNIRIDGVVSAAAIAALIARKG